MLSVGCNDLDHNSAQKVFEDLKNLVVKIQGFYPGIKVIVGEVTPRMDEKDELVKEVNALINTYRLLNRLKTHTSSATVTYVIRSSFTTEILSISGVTALADMLQM